MSGYKLRFFSYSFCVCVCVCVCVYVPSAHSVPTLVQFSTNPPTRVAHAVTRIFNASMFSAQETDCIFTKVHNAKPKRATSVEIRRRIAPLRSNHFRLGGFNVHGRF